MPRNRNQSDPKSERLAQLAAIAQIYSGLQGPQVRQQEQGQQNALAVLGLIMQQQNQQAQLKQQQGSQQQAHEIALGQLANQGAGIAYGAANSNAAQQQAQREAENTRSHQQYLETLGLGQLANQGATLAYNVADQHSARELDAQKLKASQEALARSGQQDTFKTLMATPGADVTSALKFLPQDQQPIVQQIHQEQVARETDKHKSAVGALTDPKMREMYLGSINVHPDVRANLLQAAVPQAMAPQPAPQQVAAQAAAPVDVVFPGSSNPPQGGLDWGRLGHLIKTIGGLVPDPATASPEQKAIWEQKRLRDAALTRR